MEKETYDLMKRHGFTEDNSIFASVHSHPDDVLEILALILLVVEFLAPGKFEFIIVGHYKTKGSYSRRCNEDKTSTSHVHLVIKGKRSELKPFIDKWNKSTPKFGGELFHAEHTEKELFRSIHYMFRDMREDSTNGFRLAPIAAQIMVKTDKKNDVIIDVLIGHFKSYIRWMKLVRKRLSKLHNGVLSLSSSVIRFWVVSICNCCCRPNPPPISNYSNYISYKRMEEKRQTIEIQHQLNKKTFKFLVSNPSSLTYKEIKAICSDMNVHVILVEDIYYEEY